MIAIQTIKNYMKQNNITYQQLSDESGIPLNTLKNIFREKTKNPRIDTMQAIERALGLSPTFTAEEQAQGAVNAPTVLSDRDLHTLGIINRAEDVLGFQFVDKHLELLDLYVEEKLKK